MKCLALLLVAFTLTTLAGPVLQMNRAFNALTELLPYISARDQFMQKDNSKFIEQKMADLQKAFKAAGHDELIKGDLFAPSYQLINENIQSSIDAFKRGKKDYAHWRMREVTSHCLDCHTKLPPSYSSSFQDGDLVIDKSKFKDTYNLGIAEFIVRRYVDAKASFKTSFNEMVIKKDFRNILLPIKQLVLIDTKVQKNPDDLLSLLTAYSVRKDLPEEALRTIKAWIPRAKHWKGQLVLKSGLKDDQGVAQFIEKELLPIRKTTLNEGHQIDLLFSSGILSNYIFENSQTKKAAEISFWLGWIEKNLQREEYFGSGDLFLKQCIKKYPTHPIAKECFKEYKESVEFGFTGSGGTDIPDEVKNELIDLEKLLKSK